MIRLVLLAAGYWLAVLVVSALVCLVLYLTRPRGMRQCPRCGRFHLPPEAPPYGPPSRS